MEPRRCAVPSMTAMTVAGHGWADTSRITRFYRRLLAERLGTLDQLNAALRAALDL